MSQRAPSRVQPARWHPPWQVGLLTSRILHCAWLAQVQAETSQEIVPFEQLLKYRA